MRTYHPIAVLATSLLLLAATVTGTAAPAAADPAPLHGLTELSPSGMQPSGRFVASPVPFAARTDAADGAVLTHYVVQRLAGGAWHPDADVVRSGGTEIALDDGAVRWRARAEREGQVGPWSDWIRVTVDSRTPAAPTATIPTSGTVGRPLTFRVQSPDRLAAAYHLARFGTRIVVPQGQDPCTVPGFACPAVLGGPVTFSVTVMTTSFIPLQVYALGRNGSWSAATPSTSVVFRADDAALTDAARWRVEDLTGTTVPEVHGGPALTVSPNPVVSKQGVQSEFDQRTIAVPSLRFAQPTVARTAATVVDTSSTFTVGVVVRRPKSPPAADLTVVSQTGDAGPAFSIVLTTALAWRFCVTTTDAVTTCATAPAFRRGESDTVVANWSTALRQIAVAGSSYAPFETTAVPGTAPLRPASGGLVIGSPPPAAATHYLGLIASPFVARGIVSAGQFRTLLRTR